LENKIERTPDADEEIEAKFERERVILRSARRTEVMTGNLDYVALV